MGQTELADLDVLSVMRHLEKCGTQKGLAEAIGCSVGKVNYTLKALSAKGLVKIENFLALDNKRKYRYLLTGDGIREKIRLTEAFIIRKKEEYEQLQKELERDRCTVNDKSTLVYEWEGVK